jgi:hypothetical protein
MATNYTRIATCAATGSNLAVKMFRDGTMSPGDTKECPHPGEHLGPDSTFEQRRAFEWAFLRVVFEKAGDEKTSAYCQSKIAALIKDEFKEAA